MLMRAWVPYVVAQWPVTKLGLEGLEKAFATPPFFAIGHVGEMVRCDLPETIFEVVGTWPWIAWGYNHLWERFLQTFERNRWKDVWHHGQSHTG